MIATRLLLVAGMAILGGSSVPGQDSTVPKWDEPGKIEVEINGALVAIQFCPEPDQETPRQVWAGVRVPNKELRMDCSKSLAARKVLIAEWDRNRPAPSSGARKPILVKGTMEFRLVKRPSEAFTKTKGEKPFNPTVILPDELEETEPVVVVESLQIQESPAASAKILVRATGILRMISVGDEPRGEKRVGASMHAAGKVLLLNCRNSPQARDLFLSRFGRIGSTSKPPTRLIVRGKMEFGPEQPISQSSPKPASDPSRAALVEEASILGTVTPKTRWEAYPNIVVDSVDSHSWPFQFTPPARSP